MKHVVGVAGGTEKIDAIYGALKGKFIHSLITDEETASPYYERMVIVNVPFISFRCWYREHSSSSFDLHGNQIAVSQKNGFTNLTFVIQAL